MKNISNRIESISGILGLSFYVPVVRLDSFKTGSFVFWFPFKGRLVSHSREEVGSRLTWAFWVTDEFSWECKLDGFSSRRFQLRVSNTWLWTWPWIILRASPSHRRILPTSLSSTRGEEFSWDFPEGQISTERLRFYTSQILPWSTTLLDERHARTFWGGCSLRTILAKHVPSFPPLAQHHLFLLDTTMERNFPW